MAKGMLVDEHAEFGLALMRNASNLEGAESDWRFAKPQESGGNEALVEPRPLVAEYVTEETPSGDGPEPEIGHHGHHPKRGNAAHEVSEQIGHDGGSRAKHLAELERMQKDANGEIVGSAEHVPEHEALHFGRVAVEEHLVVEHGANVVLAKQIKV